MRRRRLLALAAGAVGLGAVAGRAQQPKVATIGILVYGRPDPKPFFASLREGLRRLGYVEERNIRLDIRSGEGNTARLDDLAADLVREKVDVIVALITPCALAAKRATRDIPIVMVAIGAPVETGLVASLARPGGNITGTSGTTAELAPKNLQILQEIVPSLRRVGIMLNEADPVFGRVLLAQNRDAAAKLGIEVRPIPAKSPTDLDAAFAAARHERVDGLVVQPSLGYERAAGLALTNRLPTASPGGGFARDGGLVSYQVNRADLYAKTSMFVVKILKGAKPADLPVEQPTKFELVINLTTARALGLAVPPSLLARADEVIE